MGNVTIKIYNPRATAERIKNRFYNRVLPILADQIISDSNVYVRKQDGTLAASAAPERGGRLIRWNTAYAKRVYYTGTPRKNVNPNASLRWFEVAKRNYSGDWSNLANKLMNGG